MAFDVGPTVLVAVPVRHGGAGPATSSRRREHNHPVVDDGFHPVSVFSFEPIDAVSLLTAVQLASPPDGAVSIEFDGGTTLAEIRKATEHHVRDAGLSTSREADFVLAVNELVANSLRHGGGVGSLRLWFDDQSVYGEVNDRGHITEPLVGRVRPPLPHTASRGLWMTNQLCELVQIRSEPGNTVVRVHMKRTDAG